MTPDPHTNPIERFLGPGRGTGGPLELLGLTPAQLSEPAVLEARDARIRQLDAHPLAETPEADEVRLALHAAAVNLLDPRVRALLGVPSDPAPTPPPARAPEPSRPQPAPRLVGNERAFERDALVTIGMHGGWGRAARQRLTLIAHVHGVSAASVSGVLARLTHRRPTAPTARAKPGQPAPQQTLSQRLAMDPVPEAEPIDDIWRIAGAVAVALVLSAVILTTLVLVVVRSGPADKPQPEPIAATSSLSDPPPATHRATADPFVPEQRTELPTANVIAHEIASATAALTEGHPDAPDRFAAGARQLGATWPSLRPADVANANAQTLGYVIAAGPNGARNVEAIRALGVQAPESREAVASRVWASGVLASIAANPNVHPDAAGGARVAMGDLGLSAPADSFKTGAQGALRELLRTMPTSPDEPWTAWAQLLSALGLDRSGTGDDLTLRALSRLLRDPDAPSDEVLGALVSRTTWREDAPARSWLLTQFNAADVSSPRLASLLSVIARTSSAAGVATDMIIDPGANPDARAAMRDRYARSWSIENTAGTTDELTISVAELLSVTVAGSRSAESDPDRMRVLAQLARANAIAARLGSNDPVGAAEELQSGTTRIADMVAQDLDDTNTLADAASDDGAWGADALTAEQTTEERLITVIEHRAESKTPVGPADAGVLVRLGFRGSSSRSSGSSVREAAAMTLARHRDSPHVLLAALDMLDSIPRTEANARTLESITGRVIWSGEREEYYARARRALLSRLLELIAVDTPEARLDRLAGLIDGYYAWASDGQTIVTSAPPAHASAAALRARLGSRVTPTPAVTGAGLDRARIERRWASRRSLAAGPISRLAAEQRALAETLAGAVLEQAPGQVTRVDAILRVLEREDAEAQDALDQSISAERAIAILWQILLTEGRP